MVIFIVFYALTHHFFSLFALFCPSIQILSIHKKARKIAKLKRFQGLFS